MGIKEKLQSAKNSAWLSEALTLNIRLSNFFGVIDEILIRHSIYMKSQQAIF